MIKIGNNSFYNKMSTFINIEINIEFVLKQILYFIKHNSVVAVYNIHYFIILAI